MSLNKLILSVKWELDETLILINSTERILLLQLYGVDDFEPQKIRLEKLIHIGDLKVLRYFT